MMGKVLLTNAELVQKLNLLVKEERKLSMEILRSLREVETRRLYAEMGYGSIYEFCIKELKYSEGAAHRRISSMRLLKDWPQVEAAIQEGKLSLTSASKVQNFLNAEKREQKRIYTHEEKLELLKKVEAKSVRECEQLFTKISPQSVKQEKTRVVSETETEIRFLANEELMQKLNKIKNLISHKKINPSYAELFETLADLALKDLDPLQKHRKNLMERKESLEKTMKHIQEEKTVLSNSEQKCKTALASLPSKRCGNSKNILSRYIPKAIKLFVWKRDKGSCTFINQNTGQRCSSQFQIQYDHILPFSQKGEAIPENLRLLCANHNRYEAIEKLGHEKMQRYLEKNSGTHQ